MLEFTSLGCTALHLVIHPVFISSKKSSGKQQSPPQDRPGQLPHTQPPSPPHPTSLCLPSLMAHFNSLPFSKVSEQKARFQVQANEPEDKRTWSALYPSWLYTSTLHLRRTDTHPLEWLLLDFMRPGRHALNEHHTGRFVLIMDQNSKLQQLSEHRTCANSTNAQAENDFITVFIHAA